MKHLTYFTLLLVFFGCSLLTSPKNIDFRIGDIWIERLYDIGEQHEFQDFILKNQKLYTSSTKVSEPNFFYCFDLNTGKVQWVNQIDNFCAFAPLVLSDVIYAITYIGHIYAFDLEGNQIWEYKGGLYHSYSHNPINNNLIISSMTDGLLEYEKQSGKLVNHFGNATWHPSNPIFFNDTMIIGGLKGFENDTLGHGNDIVCFKYKTKKKIWRRNKYMGNILKHEDYIYYLDLSYNLHKIDYRSGVDLWIAQLNPESNSGFYVESNHQEKNKILFYINEPNGHKYYVFDCLTGTMTKHYSDELQNQGFLQPQIQRGNITIDNCTFEYCLINSNTLKIKKIN